MSSRLFICIFAHSEQFAQSLSILLSKERYHVNLVSSDDDFINFVEQNKEQIDCLILSKNLNHKLLLTQLCQMGILLPAILLESDARSQTSLVEEKSSKLDRNEPVQSLSFSYHSAEVNLTWDKLEQIPAQIERAIKQFLNLAPSCELDDKPIAKKIEQVEGSQNFLMLQQRRLAEKLQERLGYLGVYYKRNPQEFYRNLTKENKQDFLKQLQAEYRSIIINYFDDDNPVNQSIDSFIDKAFFADLSVQQILEIHMDLMDEFAHQLKLEGRNDEVLLDYRLALIDIVAHLCEMYRRSIPREDIPFELLFRID